MLSLRPKKSVNGGNIGGGEIPKKEKCVGLETLDTGNEYFLDCVQLKAEIVTTEAVHLPGKLARYCALLHQNQLSYMVSGVILHSQIFGGRWS